MDYQQPDTGPAFRVNWPQLALTALVTVFSCMLALMLYRALMVREVAAPVQQPPVRYARPRRPRPRPVYRDQDDDDDQGDDDQGDDSDDQA